MSSVARRSGFTLLELLLVVAIVAVLLALLLPAVQMVRAAAWRTDCGNRLRQIGLAVHEYGDTHGCLPPGCSYRNGADPQPYMSWMARLLPGLEQQPLWEAAVAAFRQAKFFELPPHQPLLGRFMREFACPADDRSQTPWRYPNFSVAFTDYLGVEGTDYRAADGVLFLDSAVRLTDVADGTANTLMVGERPPSSDHNLGWWYAGWGQLRTGSGDLTLGVREVRVHPRYRSCPAGPYTYQGEPQDDVCAAFRFWSFHPGGANFLLCDCSVRFLTYSADPVMPALATRAGGEPVAVPD